MTYYENMFTEEEDNGDEIEDIETIVQRNEQLYCQKIIRFSLGLAKFYFVTNSDVESWGFVHHDARFSSALPAGILSVAAMATGKSTNLIINCLPVTVVGRLQHAVLGSSEMRVISECVQQVNIDFVLKEAQRVGQFTILTVKLKVHLTLHNK